MSTIWGSIDILIANYKSAKDPAVKLEYLKEAHELLEEFIEATNDELCDHDGFPDECVECAAEMRVEQRIDEYRDEEVGEE